MTYFVKTVRGYFYAIGYKGRYGRVEGSRTEAWPLCENHARNVLNNFNKFAPELGATKEAATGICRMCQIQV